MSTPPIYLLDIVAAVDSAGTTSTLRFATRGYSSKRTDSPADTAWLPYLVEPGNLEQTLFPAGGAGRYNVGTIELVNTDGTLDALMNYGFSGRQLTLRSVNRGAALSTAVTIMTATMEQPEFTSTGITIRVRDKLAAFDVQLAATVYAGSNSLPNGLEGTADDLKGKPKPRLYGRAFNIAPPCVNTSRLIYQVHDGAVDDVTAVYDRAATLTRGADYTSQADMETNTPAAGTWRAWLAGGYFRLGSMPSGQITADPYRGGTASARYVGALLNTIVQEVDATIPMVAGDLTALNTIAPYEAGYWVSDTATAGQVMDAIAKSCGAWYAFDPSGSLRLGRFGDPDGTDALQVMTGRTLAAGWTILGTETPIRSTVRAGTGATRWNASGYLETVAANTARLDYNPATLAYRGVLVEPAGSNLITYSENAADGSWTKTNVTVAADQTAGVYGTSTMDAVNTNGTTAERYVRKNYSFTSGQRYVASCVVKLKDAAAKWPWIRLTTTAFGTVTRGHWDASTGSLTSSTGMGGASGAVVGSQPLGNGLYRLWVAATATASATASADFGISPSGTSTGVSTALAAGLGCYIDNFMLEPVAAGVNAPSSYIPTTVAAVNRAADVVTVVDLLSLVGTREVLELERLASSDTPNGVPVWQVALDYARYFTVQNSDIAGAVTAARREQLAIEYRRSTQSNAATKNQHKLAGVLERQTLLANAADADLECLRLLSLHGTMRGPWRVVAQLTPEQSSKVVLGTPVNIKYGRYGMTAGKNCLIIGAVRDVESGEYTLTVWG